MGAMPVSTRAHASFSDERHRPITSRAFFCRPLAESDEYKPNLATAIVAA